MTKCIVITGASSGIGQALAISFANSGYDVVAIGQNEINLQKIKSFISNGNVITICADLSEENGIDKVAQNLALQNGVQFLIHCAAISKPYKSLMDILTIELKQIINVNVMTPILLTQKLAPYFDETTRVLFIGSDYVGIDKKIRPYVTGAYGISKSALRVAVEYFRREYDKALIGYLNPGTTDTPMYQSMVTAINQQGIFNHQGQIASPRDIAEFIQGVLEKTCNQDYKFIDWDYREIMHHQLIERSSVRAKL